LVTAVVPADGEMLATAVAHRRVPSIGKVDVDGRAAVAKAADAIAPARWMLEESDAELPADVSRGIGCCSSKQPSRNRDFDARSLLASD
jgi:hypothetical protein